MGLTQEASPNEVKHQATDEVGPRFEMRRMFEIPSPSKIRALVSSLSLHSLRVELSRRELDYNGERDVLEARLVQDLTEAAEEYETFYKSHPDDRIHPPVRSPLISVPNAFNEQVLRPFSHARNTKRRAKRAKIMPASGSNVNGDDVVMKPTRRLHQFVGQLVGDSVWVMGDEQMMAFWQCRGPCGKANLSRSAPSYNGHSVLKSANVKGRALRQMLAIEEKQQEMGEKSLQRDELEHLQLTLVEAYYESFLAKSLRIKDENGNILRKADQTWHLFSTKNNKFPLLFVAYCRYRAAGWLPRSGIKYGVDWVLYPEIVKGGHSHSPYCVILRYGAGSKIDRNWTSLQNRLRLCKSVAKNLVLVQVWTEGQITDASISLEDAFKNVNVVELTVDRWLP